MSHLSNELEGLSVEGAYVRPHTGEYVAPHEDEWTWERVQEMVSTTRGFYARDWPLQLGWNNVRYIIEAGLLHASLLNRTLVLPSFIYARSCLYEFDVCSTFAQKFHRGPDIGMGDFAFLSEAEQTAWRLPISLMIDLPSLRRAHPVITVSEYLRLHALDPTLELGNGAWSAELYHGGEFKPTLRTLPTSEWDDGIVRVDREYDLPKGKDVGGVVDKVLRERLNDDGSAVGNIGHAQNIMHDANVYWRNTAQLEQLLHDAGFGVLHTFRTSFVEMFKAVTEYDAEAAPLDKMHGLVEDFGDEPADVFHVQGETHWNRKAGQLRFTTSAGRTHFAELVLNSVHPIPPVRALGDLLARRMLDRNNGRQYMAAHMRRGDFAVLNWAEKTIEEHMARIVNRMENGLKSLREWTYSGLHAVEVPGITPGDFAKGAGSPRVGDAFFLATDATSKSDVDYIHSQGAVLLADLIQPGDERLLGWPALFGDVRAQVEQEVAARAAYFYGHSMSSVAGGVANLRGARGKDPRTCHVD
ncbi:hypothetical protein PENSPDRAFT_589221 [Peniophora sp. CONT]|nr:hypothetical protein PENSPDRAFT_589221 [Peniophora sp. CONT]